MAYSKLPTPKVEAMPTSTSTAVSAPGVSVNVSGSSSLSCTDTPLVGLTAWAALVVQGRMKRGDRALIHAGSGGVGTFAIQLAKHLGAHVATTCSERNFELVRSLGADEVIDYRTTKFEEVLSGYDFVLDALGGAIRDGRWKLIEWYEDGAVELYDLEADPGEANDLAQSEPAIRDRLHARLRGWRAGMAAPMPTPIAAPAGTDVD